MIKGPKKTVSLLLPMAQYERLRELALATDRTVPGYIRALLSRYLRQLDAHTPTSSDWWSVS